MIFRPATPGFLVTLVATILLAVVSFSVPWFKSVFFLKATVDFDGQSGTATFGVLGYCLNAGGKVNCTSPQVGYEFDPNSLLGNKTPIKIPEVVVKWLTYALVLHIVALAFAAGSAIFGLLAHIREMSMTCCSTCISGFGAAVAFIAFIFDIAFFFLTKARINSIKGGSAQTGNAIWLTLAAWLLLLFAGCFYGFGRCCISSRPRGPRDKNNDQSWPGSRGPDTGKAETLRLDAVKAEADRKARQKQGEIGLPAFQEYDPTKPLTSRGYDDEEESYSDHHAQLPKRQASAYSANAASGGYAPNHTGYAPAAPGTRAMDSYYNAPAPATSPQPPAAAGYHSQQPSHIQQPSTQYDAYANAAGNVYSAAPAVNTYGVNAPPSHDQYLSAGNYAHQQYGSQQDAYGHPTQDSTYYSAASHYQQPSHNPESSYYNSGGYHHSNSPTYPSSGALPTAVLPSTEGGSAGVSPSSYYPPSQQFPAGTAAGNIGRDDYTFSGSPAPAATGAHPPPVDTSYNSYGTSHQYDASASNLHSPTTGPRGPRSPTSPAHAYGDPSHQYDSPPGYEPGEGTSAAPTWPNEKR